jgi:hypothetical protein
LSRAFLAPRLSHAPLRRVRLLGVDDAHPAEMMRSALAATGIAVVICTLSACGGGHTQAVRTVTVVSHTPANSPRTGDVLTLSGLGTFEGRCPRGRASWRLRFINVGSATDTIAYRVGAGVRRSVNVDPGNAITFRLVPGAARTQEPADRFVPPLGQGRGLAAARTVPTTAPLQATIYQGTEPQTLRADVHVALTAIGGESGQCVLVGSTVNAYTYPNS